MATVLILLGMLALIVGIVNVIHPISAMRIPNRRIAAYVLAGGLVLTIIGGAILPASPAETPTPNAVGGSTATQVKIVGTITQVGATATGEATIAKPTSTVAPGATSTRKAAPTVQPSPTTFVPTETLPAPPTEVPPTVAPPTAVPVVLPTDTPVPPAEPTAVPVQPTAAISKCDPSYPDMCIPPPPPDLDCKDIRYRNFKVLPPDPHHFDSDGDGIGCES